MRCWNGLKFVPPALRRLQEQDLGELEASDIDPSQRAKRILWLRSNYVSR
jgi:hypothetical protein